MAVGVYDPAGKYLGYFEVDILSRVERPYVEAYVPSRTPLSFVSCASALDVSEETLDIVGFERVRTRSGYYAYKFVRGSLEALKRMEEFHYAGVWPKLGSFLNEAEGRD